MLTTAGTGDTMCGDTLKLIFKFRAKAYARKGTIYFRTCCCSSWIISLFIKTFGWFKVHSVTNNIVNNLEVTAMQRILTLLLYYLLPKVLAQLRIETISAGMRMHYQVGKLSKSYMQNKSQYISYTLWLLPAI